MPNCAQFRWLQLVSLQWETDMWNEGGAAPATLPATLPAAAPVLTAPGAEAQQVMARSPSHESFGTDLSLLSLSSLGSELGRLRGAHRASRCLLQVKHHQIPRAFSSYLVEKPAFVWRHTGKRIPS